MKMRGVHVDHATIQRYEYKFAPLVEMQMKECKVQVGGSWRMDKTCIKIKGKWCYLYRADRFSHTVDFLLTNRRQRISAQSFLIKAISNKCSPRVINIDKSGSNTAAIKVYNKRFFSNIKIRQCKYLNNIVEQDNRFIKWRILTGLGFKNFQSTKRALAVLKLFICCEKIRWSDQG